MNNSYKIEVDEFVTIDDIYYGGSNEILYLEDSLSDFSKYFSSGSFAVTDILIYEMNKHSKIIGTMGKYDLTREEYANTLRNYVDSVAYRQFGFLSVNAISNYLDRFSNKRRIKIGQNMRREFFSESQFESFVVNGINADHPIILQLGKFKPEYLNTFSVITGYEDGILTISSNGKKHEASIKEIFNYEDREMGTLYIEVNV